MPRILKFTLFSFRDLWITAGPAVLITIVIFAAAYWLIDPTPPKEAVLSTGQENSAYEQFGKQYAEALAKHGVTISTKQSLGSLENLERLIASDGKVDAAFVQTGSVDTIKATQHGLLSLGSLFTEPVWIFYRQKLNIKQLSDLRGLRVNIGQAGTGVPLLFHQLLSVNGMLPENIKSSTLQNTPATVELLEGRIDALVFSSAPDDVLVQMLLQTPGIGLFDFAQAEAYTRRFPNLSHVVLPRGIVDLGRNIPAKDHHLIAPMATLVVRQDLHPALIDLLVQAVSTVHQRAGWFQKQGELPSASYTEIPVAEAATKYYRDGPPFLQRYMPFWLANLLGRTWVILLPLGALLLPLMRVLPPIYVWRVRSRVFRWYGQLREVEQAIEGVPVEQRKATYEHQLARLNDIEEKLNQVSIPLSFAEELYGLRSHINFVRKRIAGLMLA